MQPPARGAGVCWYHSGAKRDVRAAGQRRLALAEARKMMETYGRPITIDPAEALLNEVHWTAGHVAWLREQVQALQPDALTWGTTEETRFGPILADSEEPRQPDAEEESAVILRRREIKQRAGIDVWLQLYQAERKHLVDVAAMAIKCGIEERRVKLAESQGKLIVDLLRKVFDDPALGLDVERKRLARSIASQHLRALAGGLEPA